MIKILFTPLESGKFYFIYHFFNPPLMTYILLCKLYNTARKLHLSFLVKRRGIILKVRVCLPAYTNYDP